MYNKNKKMYKYLVLSISIFFMMFVWYSNLSANTNYSTISHANIENIDNYNYNINIYYQISDLFNGVNDITLEEFLSQENSLEKLIKMNKDLNENFNFAEVTFQPLYTLGYYTGDIKFTNTANGRVNSTNQEVYINGEKTFVTPLNTLKINNHNIFKPLEDKILIGRYFKEHDFIFDLQSPIPIILGYEYKNYYDINDTIKLNYLFTDFDFNVIGFLEKDTYIIFKGTEYLLDNYLVIPNFDVLYLPEDEETVSLLQKHYVQKNQGFIQVEELLVKNLSYEDKEYIYNNYYDIVAKINKDNNMNYELFKLNHIIGVK